MDTMVKPNLPDCDIVYGKQKQIEFFLSVEEERWKSESPVMKQADRLHHVTWPVGARPPQTPSLQHP